ncbi:MAG: sigma-70 family RNA polymerase sigma factor [bacterium]|nr:sigma-70 family RNA polymerase sigma factor [bacterium]
MKRLSHEEIDLISRTYLNFKEKSNNSTQDLERFKDYQNFSINKLAYLVKFRAARYGKFPNYPDLVQDGYEALIRAFDTFDPDKGSFSWWADKYIGTKISRAANAHSTIRFPIKKAKALKPYKTSTMPVLIDDAPDPLLFVETGEKNNNLKAAIDNLSDAHQNVVNMTYGFDGIKRSVSVVLKDLDISKPQYLKILREAKEQIKQQLVTFR